MPTGELAEVVRELRSEAGAEDQNHKTHLRTENRLQEEAQELEAARAQMGDDPIFETREWATRQRIERMREELAGLPEVRHDARAELAAARSIQAQREQAAATAARLSPPDYVTRELGERPSDPTRAREWDRAVRGIEGYRTRNGVVDRDKALGAEPHEHSRQREHQEAREHIEQAQRQLRLQHHQERSIEQPTGRGIGL